MLPNNVYAIIGEIGSGKTTVLKILKNLGYFVVESDEINKKLLNDEDYLSKLKKAFPDCFINDILNKMKLRNLISVDEDSRIKLNSIAHPIIVQLINKEIENREGTVFVEISAPTKENMSLFPNVIKISANDNLLEKRVLDRDVNKCFEVLNLIKTQRDVLNNLDLKYTYTIINDGSLKDLESKVVDMINNILGK